MEVFSRTQVSAQLSNKVGHCPSRIVSIILQFHKRNSLPLGPLRDFISSHLRAPGTFQSRQSFMKRSSSTPISFRELHTESIAFGNRHLLLNILPWAWLLPVEVVRLHVGDLHAVGWGEGP